MRIRTIYCLFAFICLTACGEKEEKKQQEVVNVVTEIVSAGNVPSCNSYVGEVEPETSVAVSFTGSGTINNVLVNSGQYVTKGQLIAVMDPTQCKNSVMAAEAMMMQAQDAYNRMKILHEKKSISDMDWVEVQSKLTQAKSTLLMSRKMLSDCNLVAPCSGVVGKKMMESGQVALPSQPVCTILNINNVNVKISIPEKEIGDISNGTKSKIYVATLDKTFIGGKIEKEIEADVISRTYSIRIQVSNKEAVLLPGMVCDVALDNKSNKTGLNDIFVPIKAIQKSEKGDLFIWKVDGKAAKRCTVTTGLTSGNYIAVKTGLHNGDRIIIKGCQKISEGSLVSEFTNK